LNGRAKYIVVIGIDQNWLYTTLGVICGAAEESRPERKCVVAAGIDAISSAIHII
jgi:hypothetical protein